MTVKLICGPPGSGKSHYVRERARRGDLIWDHDLVAHAFTGGRLAKYDQPKQLLPFVMAARAGVFAELRDSTVPAWVITATPDRGLRAAMADELSADVVMLDVDPNQCMNNILADPDRGRRAVELTQPIIDEWWRSHTR